MNFNFLKIKNDIFNKENHVNNNFVKYQNNNTSAIVENDIFQLVKSCRENKKDIIEKSFGNISSFNFSKKVFYKGNWSELSKLARGLFINTETNQIVGRGYDKFFNLNEGAFNSIPWLHNNLKFPVTLYKKYNGFLGILGFDDSRPEMDKLVFCSKSTPDSNFAIWFKNIFMNSIPGNKNQFILDLENYMRENNLTFIFEVIDIENDPHIIQYANSKIVLLGAIKRTINFEEVPYEQLRKIAIKFNWLVKSIEKVFNTFEELNNFINEFQNDDVSEIEGYVVEDSNKYMFKLKGKYYKMWKHLRSVKDVIAKGHTLPMGWAQTPIENYFVNWCKKQDREYLLNTDIITLRNKFLNEH